MADPTLQDPNQPQAALAGPQTMSPRMQALQTLASQLPVANSRVAQGQQAARQLQIQNAVKAAPAGGNTIQNAQATGAASAQSASDQMIENAKNQMSQQGQVGQLGLQQQAQEGQAQTFGLEQGARQQAMDNVQRLANIDADAKKEVYDYTMQFQKDENNRTLFNERQLSDFTRMNAQSEQDYLDKAQQAKQLTDRNLMAMEQAYKLVQEDLDNRYQQAVQAKDNATIAQIQQMKVQAQKQMDRARNAAANNQAAWQAGGTIVGTVAGGVAGTVFGGPGVGTAVGASAGGALGGAAGGMIGSQTAPQPNQ